jgi:hypothetical protein
MRRHLLTTIFLVAFLAPAPGSETLSQPSHLYGR